MAEEYSKFETEEEKPIEVQGFEEFDFSAIKGRKIIAKALEILPKGSFSATIERIEFEKKIVPALEPYGFSGTVVACFYPQETGHKIKFFLPSTKMFYSSREKIDYLRNIPFRLGHEWGHCLDPRLADQRDLTPQEQLKIVMDWEKIRAEEEEQSGYVLRINNPDKKREELLKSKESFAESVAYFLNNPLTFQHFHPRRYEFISNLFKKRSPEFDLEKICGAKIEYDTLLKTLDEEETKAIGEEKTKVMEKILKKIFKKRNI